MHFVGWPLPDHVPTWDETQATLLNSMSPPFLLNTLAVLCWIVWFFFAIDVLRCTVDAARGITWPQVRPPGPLHGLAAALIGTIVLTLLGSRTPYTGPAPVTAALTGDLAPIAVVAPLTPGPAAPALARQALVVQQATLVIDRAAPAPPGTVLATEEVRLPQNGIYDSLWRVAERVYGPGGGSRWPELFQLNRGVEQPDGRTLANPNLVRPGWKITAYIPAPPSEPPPGEQLPPVPPEQPVPPTSTAPTTPPSTQPAPTTQAPPATDQADQHGTDQAEPGLDLMTGVFVSLGLAGLVTTAMVSARMWRRRRYRVGSGDRADLQRPIAPVVRALRTAHDDHDDDLRSDEVEFIDLAPAPPRIHITAGGALEPDDEPIPVPARVGVRGGSELALNLASTRGLGLAGPGAADAARALLLHLLAEHQPGGSVCVIIPAEDLHLVFDGTHVEHLPSTVLVVDSLDAALDEMEAALLTRTRHAIEETEFQPTPASLVLLASPTPHAERRLQAVLDNGSTLGLAGILLGQWRPGATVRIRPDGTVSATSPGLGDALTGTRLFTLPAADTTELLTLLRDAEGPTDLPGSGVEPGAAGDGGLPLVDVAEDDDRIAQPSVPEQRSVEEMTRLESTRPPDRQNDPAAPMPSLQVLDVHAAPVDVQPPAPVPASPADDADGHRTTTDDLVLADNWSTRPENPPKPAVGDQPATRRPLAVRVLGRVYLALQDDSGERELGGALTPKQREVLVYLALHPHGVRREVLNEAVWPDSRPPRPYNSFHNTLSMLRRALSDATDGALDNVVLNDDGRYQLNPDLVTVDFWHLQHALQAPRPTDGDALLQLHDAVELYQGDLAEDLLVPWVEPFRETIRRDVLDALGALIRTHGDADPETMLTLLERTRKLDRYNEGVYRDIIRTQARLGQYAAIPRTLALLTATLDEIGQHPSADTLNLADFLQRRGSTRRQLPTDNAAAS
ncbi:BTAD domain-containing putative transcriptional regulator [Amycolatopsis saalfeldensis]|uniref:BTAD domain-containing putative transcriptional regulator n=1 Tax=Amycolatopsis saalfeldensis TaxID=394193 RepID=UPI001160C84C|nr:BTAD domain-containing putative transcriptional regulator [Amycolatopsis saalfeldensis]